MGRQEETRFSTSVFGGHLNDHFPKTVFSNARSHVRQVVPTCAVRPCLHPILAHVRLVHRTDSRNTQIGLPSLLCLCSSGEKVAIQCSTFIFVVAPWLHHNTTICVVLSGILATVVKLRPSDFPFKLMSDLFLAPSPLELIYFVSTSCSPFTLDVKKTYQCRPTDIDDCILRCALGTWSIRGILVRLRFSAEV